MGDCARKPPDIGERTFAYALSAVTFYRTLPVARDRLAHTLGLQYLRAATSVGANIDEARYGESRADFIHKFAIARKEARECRYWLRLLVGSSITDVNAARSLLDELDELLAIITTIILKTKGKPRSNY